MATTDTTLARAAAINDQILYLTSSATAVPGTILEKGAEYAKVIRVLNSGAVRVQRGVLGTSATASASGDAVTVGDVEDFLSAAPISGIADGDATIIIPSNPPASASAGGGGSILHQATVTLAHAAIVAVGTVVPLVAAPGANKAVMPVATTMAKPTWLTAYTNVSVGGPTNGGNGILLVYGNDDADATTYFDQSALGLTGPRTGTAIAANRSVASNIVLSAYASVSAVNASLNVLIRNAAGPLTAGHATNTLTFSVAYLVLDTTTGLFE